MRSATISLIWRATSGEMIWQGAPYAPATPRDSIDAGVGMIHQKLLLPHLSIAENIFVGRYPKKAGRIDHSTMEDQAAGGLQRLGLNVPASRVVEGLSTANQQLIEIAKALALNAKLLILDEPTAALGSEKTQKLFEQIARLRAEGANLVIASVEPQVEEAAARLRDCRGCGLRCHRPGPCHGALRPRRGDLCPRHC